MKRFWTALLLAAALAGSTLPSPGSAADARTEILTNADIVGMVRAGFAPELITGKINTTPNYFDLSTRSMITMRENGVPDAILQVMMAASNRAPAPRPLLDQARYGAELGNIAAGSPEAKNAALAWMLANRTETIPALRAALGDTRPEIRSAALLALGQAGDTESLPAVRNLLTDASPLVRRTTAQTLAVMNDTSSVAAAEQAVGRQVAPLDGYIYLLGYARDTKSAEALGHVLAGNPEPTNRVAAAWSLGEIGRAGVTGRPALERALDADTDPSVRREAAQAVAKLRDSASAVSLMNACRYDPEVRTIALAALADYPEAVEFLVWVMSLGGDLISVDEQETARASLARLTGQNFGLDSARWSEWYAANRGRYATAVPFQTPAAAPAVLAMPPATAPRSGVDVVGNLVADSTSIPMAPMAEGPAAAPGPQFGPGLPPPAPGPAAPGQGESTARLGTFSPIPETIPEMDLRSDAVSGGTPADAPALRTWTSDPTRPAPTTPAAPARPSGNLVEVPGWTPEPNAGGPGAEGPLFPTELPADPFASSPAPFRSATTPPPAERPAAPAPAPVVAAPAAAPEPVVVQRPEPPPLTGMSLPLPPMGGEMPDYGDAGDEDGDEGPDEGFDDPFAAPADAENPFQAFPDALPPPPAVWDAPPPVPPSAPGFPAEGEEGHGEAGSTAIPEAGGDIFPPLEVPEYPEHPGDMPADEFGAEPPTPSEEGEGGLSLPVDGLHGDDHSNLGAGADYVPPPPAAAASGMFVEPEAGQMVIGESLFGPTPTVSDVPYQATPSPAPVVAAPDPFAQPPAATEDPYAQDSTLRVTPPGGQVPPPPPAATPRQSRRAGRNAAPPPPPAVSAPTPAPIPSAPPATTYSSEPSYDNRVFSDPSVPLPPVKPEGTVTAPRGKDQPPTLGEGIF